MKVGDLVKGKYTFKKNHGIVLKRGILSRRAMVLVFWDKGVTKWFGAETVEVINESR